MATKKASKANKAKTAPRTSKVAIKAPVKTEAVQTLTAVPVIARRTSSVEAETAAERAAEKVTDTIVMPALKPTKRGLWQRLFQTDPAKKALKDNLAAVKTGVLHEFETMSNHKGIPLSASPFQNIMLPPRAKPRYGVKAAVLLVFLCVFGAIMLLAGQLAEPESSQLMANSTPNATLRILSATVTDPKMQPQTVSVQSGINAAQPTTPLSRADVTANNKPAATALTILKATKMQVGDDTILLSLILQNTNSQSVTAGPLHVAITDAAGRTLKDMNLALENTIQPYAQSGQTWTIPLDKSNKLDSFVKMVPLEALRLTVRIGA